MSTPTKKITDPHAKRHQEILSAVTKYITEPYEHIGHIARQTGAPPAHADVGIYGREILPGTGLTVRYCTIGIIRADFLTSLLDSDGGDQPQGQPVEAMKSNPEAPASIYASLRVSSGCCKMLWDDTLVWYGAAEKGVVDGLQADALVESYLWPAIVQRTHQALDNDEGTHGEQD